MNKPEKTQKDRFDRGQRGEGLSDTLQRVGGTTLHPPFGEPWPTLIT